MLCANIKKCLEKSLEYFWEFFAKVKLNVPMNICFYKTSMKYTGNCSPRRISSSWRNSYWNIDIKFIGIPYGFDKLWTKLEYNLLKVTHLPQIPLRKTSRTSLLWEIDDQCLWSRSPSLNGNPGYARGKPDGVPKGCWTLNEICCSRARNGSICIMDEVEKSWMEQVQRESECVRERESVCTEYRRRK